MIENFCSIQTRMAEKWLAMTGIPLENAQDIGIRINLFAGELEKMHQLLEQTKKQSNVQSATGQFLDDHAYNRGLVRKKSTHSQGVLRFIRSAPVAQDFLIPKGVICSNGGYDNHTFITTQDITIPKQETQIDIPAISEKTGKSTNLLANRITNMLTPILGFVSVTNPSPFFGGSDDESDEQLKKRILQSYQANPNGINLGYYENLVAQIDGVSTVCVIPNKRGYASLDVIITSNLGVLQSVMDNVNTLLKHRKELGMDILVKPATEHRIDITLAISILPTENFAQVRTRCEEALHRYFDLIRIGQRVNIANIYAQIMRCNGVVNCSISHPNSDFIPTNEQILRLNNLQITPIVSR